MLADQLKSPVVWLLSAAAVLAAAFGEWKQAAAILIVLLINTMIGFFTEFRAVRSMEGLRKLGTRSSRVRRDGKLKTIPAELVVPGDIVLFESGDVVTADIRLVEVRNLFCDESTLTGESVPVGKTARGVSADVPFRGTSVVQVTGAVPGSIWVAPMPDGSTRFAVASSDGQIVLSSMPSTPVSLHTLGGRR
jgi:Ca2+-transporting ATPase